ncbi:Holliday junction branch migration protein RuvA [Acetilactobacillus jinshanensis]|uniref:Holliday junction branch migration complex subunit RuvA n=1 Tax=Acetilactobacillus jinshanensis TaxID=1720083 RepID=A0A4P6ZNE7_9LACO|nr:Holliday junction branch migration protein RuvA [Acetilactobacillus jinshanensis]QBP18740.1 Holliday junction branch migration protein RuvA [Acetilactobacillus jinshanensis]
MFEYFIGYVTDIKKTYIVLEVNGIGYKVYVPNASLFKIDSDHKIKVYIHQAVSDVADVLYGFKSQIDKSIFERLINVSGIGPKNAIAILSGNDQQALLNAINEENVTYLTKFPGVGKKTAKQIILDLQGKLDDLLVSGASNSQPVVNPKVTPHLQEALEALQALGYSNRDVKSVEGPLAKNSKLTTNQYISAGLKLLNRLS